MTRFFRSFPFLLAGVSALTACEDPAKYQTIASTAATTSDLAGVGLNLTTAGGSIVAANVVGLTGALTHNTGGLEIDDGIYLLVDANGFDVNGVATDGVATAYRLDAGGTGLFTRTYDYVIPIGLDYVSGGFTTTTGGTIGIRTDVADVPVAGIGQYTGEAFTRYVSKDGLTDFFLTNGISIVDVDFAAGSVDVTLGLFTTVNGVTGPTTASPIDAVSGTGMSVIGASFYGGRWVTYKDGGVVRVTGTNTIVQAGGDFFGYDPSVSGPDEVAGVFLVDGDTATVYGIFLAD